MPTPYFAVDDPMVDIRTGRPSRTFGLLCQFWHRLFRGKPVDRFIQWGTGSPETVVAAPVGSVWIRTDGGASTVLYVKEANITAIGWVAK